MRTVEQSTVDAADFKSASPHAEALPGGALQRAIFNSANFSSIATDARGVIQIFNVGAERMLGYTAAEMMNKVTPADISDPQEIVARAKTLSVELGTPIAAGFEALVFKASRGIEDIYELTYFRKDGSRFPAVVSVTALRDEHDIIIGYLLIGTDNTARKHIEEERMKLEQRVRDQHFYTRSLIESNIDALMTTDPRGIITDVNKQAESLTGCTRDELIGAPFKNSFTDAHRAEAGISRVLSEGKVTNYELTARARDGTLTDVSYNATTFHDRDRRLQGVFIAARDVTERKQIELALQKKNVELERSNAALDEFASVASHDLQEPLRKILAFGDRLRTTVGAALETGPREDLDRMLDAAVRMQTLTSDLLTIAQVTTRVRAFEATDLGRVAREVIADLELTIAETGGRIELGELPVIDADALQMRQLLQNLLGNALKYRHKGIPPVIQLRSSASDGARCIITVTDNGIGFNDKYAEKIFQMFERLHGRTEYAGTGMGLAICRKIVERHGGTIAAKSRPDQGAVFTVTLPVAQAVSGLFS